MWIGRLNVVKVAILYMIVFEYSMIPAKILASLSVEIYKLLLKFMWRFKRYIKVKTIVNKENYSSQF